MGRVGITSERRFQTTYVGIGGEGREGFVRAYSGRRVLSYVM